MEILEKRVGKLLKLVLFAGVTGVTAALTLYFLNCKIVVRDVDQSINKTGVVHNVYGGISNINNSITAIDRSVKIVNDLLVEIYGASLSIQKNSEKLSTEKSGGVSSNSLLVLKQDFTRIASQVEDFNQFLNVSSQTNTTKGDVSVQFLSQNLQSISQFSFGQTLSEELDLLQILFLAPAPRDFEDLVRFGAVDTTGSRRQPLHEVYVAVPEPPSTLGVLVAGVFVVGSVLLRKARKV